MISDVVTLPDTHRPGEPAGASINASYESLLSPHILYARLLSGQHMGDTSMRCPFCSHSETKVVDSRDSDSQDAIRRRRECLACGRRFTTYERREETPLMVIKKDGSTEPFDRGKLLRGIVVATAKRPISPSALEQLIDDIEAELHNAMQYEVPAKQLGDMVLVRLLDLDEVAYIRFASVYKEFSDLDSFTAELTRLGARKHHQLDDQ